MKKIFTIISIFVMIASASAQKKPEWVIERPFSNDYFIGVNFSSKATSDYIDQAKSKALKDLSSEIIVNINSETFLKTTEIDNEVKQSYENKIKTNVQKDLEGYEQVDVWQDKNEYWVYYRLSKSTYYSLKRQKFEAAVSSSSDLSAKAKQLEASGNYVQAMQTYVLSTKPIEPYLGETFDLVLKNKSSELLLGAIISINNILANTKIVSQNKKIDLKLGEKVDVALNLKAVCASAGSEKNISNLPLTFINEKGEITLSSRRAVTNDQGFCTTQMTNVVPVESSASLKATIDLSELFKEYSDVLITQSLVKKAVAYDLFVISINKPTIYFASSEKNLSTKLSVNLMEPALKEFFKQNNFSFVPSKSNADFVVTISADTRKGGQAYDLSITFLDAEISIINVNSNEQIYTKQFANIKGVKQDHTAAGSDAYRKVINANFKNELFPELKEKFKLNP